MSNPFTSPQFLKALQEGECTGGNSGWDPVFIHREQSWIPLYAKNHSYGEYIFDWEWADAYRRHGLAYYPKLVSMAPVSPVIVRHLLNCEPGEESPLLAQFNEFYESGPYSSAHFLFLDPSEIALFEQSPFMLRHSFQYHFVNDNYANFDQFLDTLKGRRSRQIRKERLIDGISIERRTGADLLPEHAIEMHGFYESTILEKGAIAYLSQTFFVSLFENMKDNVLYVRAMKEGTCVAGALFLYGAERLYGRYWGAREYVHNLHFELCYYQGIDFCIEKKLKVFEAGAQGEHKIQRGFRPVIIHSAHLIKHPEFRKAIDSYIQREKMGVEQIVSRLRESLPFKNPSNQMES